MAIRTGVGREKRSTAFTFTDARFVLGERVPVERRADHTAQPPVAGSVEPKEAPAALVALPGTHEAAAADVQDDAAGAVLGLLAPGLVARQADERPRPGIPQEQQRQKQQPPRRQVPVAADTPAPPPRRQRCQVHPGQGRRSPRGSTRSLCPGPARTSPVPAAATAAAPPPPRPLEKSFLSAAAAPAKLLLQAASRSSPPSLCEEAPILLPLGFVRVRRPANWPGHPPVFRSPGSPLSDPARGYYAAAITGASEEARAKPLCSQQLLDSGLSRRLRLSQLPTFCPLCSSRSSPIGQWTRQLRPRLAFIPLIGYSLRLAPPLAQACLSVAKLGRALRLGPLGDSLAFPRSLPLRFPLTSRSAPPLPVAFSS